MERKPWEQRHFLYGMFAGTCIGAVLAVTFYWITADQMFLMLISLGFALGLGVGAARSILERREGY